MKKVAGRPRRSAAWANLRKYTVAVEYTKLPAARTFFELYGAQAAIEELNRLLVVMGHAVSLPQTQQELIFGKAVDIQGEQKPPVPLIRESAQEVDPALVTPNITEVVEIISTPAPTIIQEVSVNTNPSPSGRRSILDLDE